MIETPGEHAAKILARRAESIKTVDLTTKSKPESFGEQAKRPKAFDLIESHYQATSTGQRSLEDRMVKDGKAVDQTVHTADRGTFLSVRFTSPDAPQQNLVTIRKAFYMEGSNDRQQIPEPLLFFYVGKKPLHEALPQGEYLGTARCLDRECDLFLFKQVRWFRSLDQVFALDRQTAVPLRVEAFRDEATREAKKPMWSWSATSIDQIQGYDLPFRSTMTGFDANGSPEFTSKSEVKRVRFNDPIPDAAFRTILQPGVMVVDEVRQTTYHTPGEVEVPQADPSKPVVAVVPPRPILASQPADGSALLSAGALGCGFALLVVGLVAWWRRR